MRGEAGQRKRALRADFRERRHAMPEHERTLATAGITANLTTLTEKQRARSVSCYLPLPTEPNTLPYLEWAEQQGIRVLLPVTRSDGLLDWIVADRVTTERGGEAVGAAGVPELSGETLSPIAINTVDLILVPALTIAEDGTRIGSGRAYFDKTLGSMEKSPPVYAVIFDHELVDALPREVHDQPVTGVITPNRIVTF